MTRRIVRQILMNLKEFSCVGWKSLLDLGVDLDSVEFRLNFHGCSVLNRENKWFADNTRKHSVELHSMLTGDGESCWKTEQSAHCHRKQTSNSPASQWHHSVSHWSHSSLQPSSTPLLSLAPSLPSSMFHLSPICVLSPSLSGGKCLTVQNASLIN